MRPAPRRALNPDFVRHIADSGQPRPILAKKCRFSHTQALDTTLRLDRVSCTPLLVGRLTALATIIGFPPGRIFSDEPTVAQELVAAGAEAQR
jgi:hypothetical protein